MSGGVINTLRTPVTAGGTVTVGQAAIATAGGLAAAVGGFYAIQDARNLYNNRQNMAGQFQNQLEFPTDLTRSNAGGESRNFFMSFTFMKYEKRSIQNSTFLRSEGSVRLPIPDALRDNLSVSYNTASLTPVVGAGLEAIAGRGASNPLSTLRDIAAGGAATTIQNLTSSSEIGRDAFQATQAYLGMAINPYQTVLFEKPEFKTHNFSWKFMPRDEEESDIARNIFRTFQFHASPGVSQGPGLFFSYPSMVIVNLYPSSDFLYRFKPCVVKSVGVNYAAGNNPSFFKRTNAPTAITLSIQLQEIEYWTNNDYSDAAFSEGLAELRSRIRQQSIQLQQPNVTTPR